MASRAYNYIILPDQSVESMVVVLTDSSDRYVSHHPLLVEEPFTEWVGGTYIVPAVQ